MRDFAELDKTTKTMAKVLALVRYFEAAGVGGPVLPRHATGGRAGPGSAGQEVLAEEMKDLV
jgi:hypothetical protein